MSVLSFSVVGEGLAGYMVGGGTVGSWNGKEEVQRCGREGNRTFGGVASLVLAPVAEDFVFYPWHVFCVGFVVLLLGPLGHGCGLMLLRMRERCRCFEFNEDFWRIVQVIE